MTTHFNASSSAFQISRKRILWALLCALCFLQFSPQLIAQSQAHRWEIEAGGKMAFETAAVRQNKTAPPFAAGSNFPLGLGDVYVPTGGQFRAGNYPLLRYIVFAYKLNQNQEDALETELPKWM